jgi:DNA-binding NtrC family response regulator
MPRTNGRQLYEAIHPSRPSMRVIYMSGYTPEMSDGTEIIGPQHAFVQKPFTIQHLVGRIRQVLDAPTPE